MIMTFAIINDKITPLQPRRKEEMNRKQASSSSSSLADDPRKHDVMIQQQQQQQQKSCEKKQSNTHNNMVVNMSLMQIVLVLLSCTVSSYGIGRFVRKNNFFLQKYNNSNMIVVLGTGLDQKATTIVSSSPVRQQPPVVEISVPYTTVQVNSSSVLPEKVVTMGCNQCPSDKSSLKDKLTESGISNTLCHSSMCIMQDTAYDNDHMERVGIKDDYHAYDKDRSLHMDGNVLQSREGKTVYYESLVHAAMFAHSHPKQVAFIAGGIADSFIVEEVLKHNTVEKVVMIEHDQMLSNWDDNPQIDVYYNEDPFQFFIDKFGSDSESTDLDNKFDVILMDIRSVISVADFSTKIYENGELLLAEAISCALGDNGILVFRIREEVKESPLDVHKHDVSSKFINDLIEEEFESITIYTETNGGVFNSVPLNTLIAMKDRATRSNWAQSEAAIQLAITRRIYKTPTGSTALHYFDGATMKTYEFPSRHVENKWCSENSKECGTGHGFDVDILNIPRSSFEVGISSIVTGGRGVFTKQFIPKGSYIALEECVNGMFVPPQPYGLISTSAEKFQEFDYYNCFLSNYIDGYGWQEMMYGDPSAGVDPGILTFVNHGCNGTYNMGETTDVTEMTFDFGPTNDISDPEFDSFHPFYDRHYPQWGCEDSSARRNIESGEELFDNYLLYGGYDWKENIQDLKSMCSGGIGSVSEYELKKA